MFGLLSTFFLVGLCCSSVVNNTLDHKQPDNEISIVQENKEKYVTTSGGGVTFELFNKNEILNEYGLVAWKRLAKDYFGDSNYFTNGFTYGSSGSQSYTRDMTVNPSPDETNYYYVPNVATAFLNSNPSSTGTIITKFQFDVICNVSLLEYKIICTSFVDTSFKIYLYYAVALNNGSNENFSGDLLRSTSVVVYNGDSSSTSPVTSGFYFMSASRFWQYFQAELTLDEQIEAYNSGRDLGYQEGLQTGLANGYNDGYAKGKEEGITEGESSGYQNGYNDAISDASNQSVVANSIFSGIFTVAMLPVNVFLQFMNFEVFGINISGLVSGLITVALVVIVLRFIFAKGGKD